VLGTSTSTVARLPKNAPYSEIILQSALPYS